MNTTETPQTFSQLLREGNRFTDRDFMKALSIGHPGLKQREADPSRFTIGELKLLAKLLGRPVEKLMKVVLAELDRNPEVAGKLEEAVEQVVGRKHFPRAPKKERPAPNL
jgi:transcriptional regulator with XRE-family HTH domain